MSVEETWEMREKRTKVFLDPRCDRCKKALTTLPMLGSNADEHRQYKNASLVDMSGSYGGFIDAVMLRLDLCGDCSQAFLDWVGIDGWDDPRWIDGM